MENMKLMELNMALKGHQILVFRSNINKLEKAERVCSALMKIEGVQHANVDLEDWENVLRLECDSNVSAKKVEKLVVQYGFECSELENDI